MVTCSFSKDFWHFRVTWLAMLCFVIEGVTSLECYSCQYTGEDQCATTTSCNDGQVCVKKVYKRYFLLTSFEAGCLDRATCRALEDLNTDRYCSNRPSDCTYCCSSQNCNAAPRTASVLWGKATPCAILILVRLLVTYCFPSLPS